MGVRIGKEEFHDKVLSSKGLVMVDFYSDSCVPCKMLSPILAELEEGYQELAVYKVNTLYESELTQEYKVMAAPTLLFFKDGAECRRLTGAQKKEALEEIIKENL